MAGAWAASSDYEMESYVEKKRTQRWEKLRSLILQSDIQVSSTLERKNKFLFCQGHYYTVFFLKKYSIQCLGKSFLCLGGNSFFSLPISFYLSHLGFSKVLKSHTLYVGIVVLHNYFKLNYYFSFFFWSSVLIESSVSNLETQPNSFNTESFALLLLYSRMK